MNNHIKLTKFCSKFNSIVGYNHFCWWNPPTNYVDSFEEDEMVEDITHAVFGFGCYTREFIKPDIFSRTMKRSVPVYHNYYFGPVSKIIEFEAISLLFDGYDRIKNWGDVEGNVEEIRGRIEDVIVLKDIL